MLEVCHLRVVIDALLLSLRPVTFDIITLVLRGTLSMNDFNNYSSSSFLHVPKVLLFLATCIKIFTGNYKVQLNFLKLGGCNLFEGRNLKRLKENVRGTIHLDFQPKIYYGMY